jgi:quercetin dioxygenase-like cupin family protein
MKISSFVVSLGAEAVWAPGRVGMLYRDLVPDHQGGSVVASQIRIEAGGAVADYVHYHDVRFQAIYCYKGWVRVVYEDQGPSFVMRPGDCVLQPPGIRHRVLESSAGMEVIEVACPAGHPTFADHTMTLPTPVLRPLREFAGQRFVRHQGAEAGWQPWRLRGFECQDTGIAAATDGFASVRIVRATGSVVSEPLRHDTDVLFLFVLDGGLTLDVTGHTRTRLTAGDAVVLPSTLRCAIAERRAETALFEVAWP